MGKLRSIKDIWNKFSFILTDSQKRWGLLVMIITLIGAIFETLGVSVALPLVQVMIEPQKLRKNAIIAPVVSSLKLDSDNSLICAVGITVVITYLVKNIFLLFLSYVRIKYACKVKRELATEMMSSYMKRGYAFFLNTNTGELLRGMNDNILYTYQALYNIFRFVAEAMTIALICVFIVITDFALALSVILLALVCLFIVVLGCQKWVKRCGEIYYEHTARINKTLLHAFQGIKEVLVMQRQKHFIRSFERECIKQQIGTIGQTVASESPTYIIEAVCVTGLIIAVCIKAIASGTGTDDLLVAKLAVFAVAAFRILPSLGRISSYFNQFMFCVPSINDTYNNFREAREVSDRKDENNTSGNLKKRKKREIESSLSAENVTWRYPGTDRNILDSVTIDIEKGQSVALVGKSGSGKTTFADIMLGLLIPQQGRIKIDGIDISEISILSPGIIGFVPQNINLMDDTVRRNVAFGLDDKEIDDESVWKALDEAQLKTVVEGTGNGLDTVIGEQGIHFSGGQRQRFAIARALYSNPDILILDEATSALDTETETAIMESIEALQGHRTLVIIAHRLTTIKNCDVIYEIVDGKAIKRKYEELE